MKTCGHALAIAGSGRAARRPSCGPSRCTPNCACGAALDVVRRADAHVVPLARWVVEIRLALFGHAVDLLGQAGVGVRVRDLGHARFVRDRDRDLGHAGVVGRHVDHAVRIGHDAVDVLGLLGLVRTAVVGGRPVVERFVREGESASRITEVGEAKLDGFDGIAAQLLI